MEEKEGEFFEAEMVLIRDSIKLEGPIVAASANYNNKMVAVGGRDVFKIISVNLDAPEVFFALCFTLRL